ncbi:hypothetical protein [Dactylosporangium darangshiense]|uniref:Serine/threonine protein kinase n=1 Tax=Dactylosporangium darangshiense TaxID=579108 RepID=A0ABP8DM17_9ACTN
MDRSGRRRRLFTVLGAGAGILLIAVGGLLIAGLLGSSPVPLPGLPNNGRGVLQRGNTDGDGLGTAPVPAARTTSARPRAGATTPAAAATPTTDKPGNRPTVHPGNGKPSRTK